METDVVKFGRSILSAKIKKSARLEAKLIGAGRSDKILAKEFTLFKKGVVIRSNKRLLAPHAASQVHDFRPALRAPVTMATRPSNLMLNS